VMRRREFMTLLGGAASWPGVARAQQAERMRHVGVPMNLTADAPDAQAQMAAFVQGLQGAGWEVGRNLRIESRWGGGDLALLRKNAADWVALNPDVILAGSGPTTPIMIEDPSAAAGQWAVIQAFSRAARVELTPIVVRSAADVERGLANFARTPNDGLIVTVNSAALIYREMIVATASQRRLPAVYPYRSFVEVGGAGLLWCRLGRSVPARCRLRQSHTAR